MTALASSSAQVRLAGRNKRVGLAALALALAMIGLGFASVPLYRLFCQVTGFGGTTQRISAAEAAQVKVADGAMSVRFDANVARGLPWHFRPEQVTQDVRIGGRQMAIYVARNDSDRPVTGTATFNVEPEQVGKYFSKVQCFCFTEQTLQPHQEMRMPVIYYVDPKIMDDPDARNVQQITLSYTFHQSTTTTANTLDQGSTGG
jgi:cytochrome c oxidase assembly protein subunit 11